MPFLLRVPGKETLLIATRSWTIRSSQIVGVGVGGDVGGGVGDVELDIADASHRNTIFVPFCGVR